MNDTIPIWTIVIWEDLEEIYKFRTLKFRGGYEEAVNYAEAQLDFYKSHPEFNISHFTLEQEKQMLSFTDLIEDYYNYTEKY